MTEAAYAEFLARKRRVHHDSGRPCDPGEIHPSLFGFQRDITAWAVRKGRAAIFADTGLAPSKAERDRRVEERRQQRAVAEAAYQAALGRSRLNRRNWPDGLATEVESAERRMARAVGRWGEPVDEEGDAAT